MRMRIQPLEDGTTEVDIRVLPDGRTVIHWLQEADNGLIKLQGHPQLRKVMGRLAEGSYSIACRPEQNTIASQKRGNVRYMCITSGDIVAVTCLQCLAIPAAIVALAKDPDQEAKASQLASDIVQNLGVK